MHPEPGREVDEPQRHTNDFAVDFCDVAVRRRRRSEERRLQTFGVKLDFIRCAFVRRELMDEADDGLDVARFGETDHGRPRGQPFFVSQKILSISAIWSSNFWTSPGSVVPLPPAAPAAFVASLKSW